MNRRQESRVFVRGGILALAFLLQAAGGLPAAVNRQMIAYSGLLGSSNYDRVTAVAVDSGGCAYLTVNQYATSTWQYTAPLKSFVAKVRADGSGLVYRYEFPAGIALTGLAVDALGRAHVAGTVWAGAALPVKGGPDSTFNGGATDAFVARLNPAGTALKYCGYLGGALGEDARAIAVDASGCAYVVGSTASTEATFPIRTGPGLVWSEYGTAYIAKVNAAGASLVYCGFLDAYDADWVKVDNSGAAYVFFPGNMYGPVARVAADGRSHSYWLNAKDFLNDDDYIVAADVDAQGNLYYLDHQNDAVPLGGGTEVRETFIQKLRPSADFRDGEVEYTTPIYGFVGTDLCVDAQGNVYVVGGTDNAEPLSPVKGPGLAFSGVSDAVVAKLDSQGDVVYCGFIGGAGADGAVKAATDARGNLYAAGATGSTPATFPRLTGPGLTAGGNIDAFLAKVSDTAHTVYFQAGTGGSLLGRSPQAITDGGGCKPVTAVPAAGYRFDGWTADTGFASSANPLTLINVTGPMTLTAHFTLAK